MKHLPLPFFYRRFPGLRAYAVLFATFSALLTVLVWSWALIHFIPAGTPVAPAVKVLLLSFPILLIQMAVNVIAVAMATEYAVLVRIAQWETVQGAAHDAHTLLLEAAIRSLRTEAESADKDGG